MVLVTSKTSKFNNPLRLLVQCMQRTKCKIPICRPRARGRRVSFCGCWGQRTRDQGEDPRPTSSRDRMTPRGGGSGRFNLLLACFILRTVEGMAHAPGNNTPHPTLIRDVSTLSRAAVCLLRKGVGGMN